MLQIVFLIIHLLFAFALFFLTLSFITGAPFVPSTSSATHAMVTLGNVKRGMTVVDLGSGDGRLLIAAAKLGAHAIGYEINPYLVVLTKLRLLFSPYRKLVNVYWRNYWNITLLKADVVFLYLIPWRMEKLANKLVRELPKGTRIVSNSYIFPSWKIDKKDLEHHIYTFVL